MQSPEKKGQTFQKLTTLIHTMLQTTREKDLRQISLIERKTDLYDDLEIDSLEIMDVLAAVEKTFHVTINTEKASAIRSVGALADYLENLMES